MKRRLNYFTVPLLLLLSSSFGNSAPLRQGTELVPTLLPGPDVIAGDLSSLQQAGSSGTQVGLAIGSDACNGGDVELDFFPMPNTDHPLTAQNLYRMSGGVTNDERFEQIGQSWLMHGFTALQSNSCSFGCAPAGSGTHLGAGCSNADSAGINGSPGCLGFTRLGKSLARRLSRRMPIVTPVTLTSALRTELLWKGMT